MKLNQLEQSWTARKAKLTEKVAELKETCPDESFAAIDELRKSPHGALLDVLHEEARLAELTSRLEEFLEATAD